MKGNNFYRSYGKLLLLWLTLQAWSSIIAIDFTPNELIFKTSSPVSLKGEKTGLTEFDRFLTNMQVSKVKAITPKTSNQFFVATINNAAAMDQIRSQNLQFRGIEYVQPNYLNQFYLIPNDTYYSNQQLYLTKLPEAWDYTTGSSDIIIGVIDSGILFDHPDLQHNIFINPNEIPDNGIDDDNNGYIDDWHGWDFTDAIELADQALGDYLKQDNDPTDENFHGTHVSGILAADSNNNEGICGVTWNCKLLVVRSGFQTTEGAGYLQDDDAAAGIIYATDMGARVINLSWGDSNYSPIIADACQYAYDHGVIVVAAAGNEPVPSVSYPARLSTVISVGAVDSYKNLAGFSSYGPDLDIVAPGDQILSTYHAEGSDIYKELPGTSMASPFVAGSIALLLSLDPTLSYEEVRSRLLSTCEDLGNPGFDDTFGYGLLNTKSLLETTDYPLIQITQPADNVGTSTEFDIIGTVKTSRFFRYSVMYSNKAIPTSADWYDVVTHSNRPTYYTSQKDNEVLAHFGFTEFMPDGTYKIRVLVEKSNGKKYAYTRSVYIDRTPPRLIDGSLRSTVRYAQENMNLYVECQFDEQVNVTLLFHHENGQTYNAFSVVSDSLHYILVPSTVPSGRVDLEMVALNHSGLEYHSGIYSDFMTIGYSSIPIHGLAYYLLGDPSIPLPRTMDIDNNGYYDFISMKLETSGPGLVSLKELFGTYASTKHVFSQFYKPLDWYKDGDSLSVIGLNSSNCYLLRNRGDLYPDSLIWTGNAVYGGLFADYNNDSKKDMLLVTDLTTARIVQLYKQSSGKFSLDLQLFNNSPVGINQRNNFVPTICVDNLNRDGITDILTADTEGDVMIYNIVGLAEAAKSKVLWSKRMSVPNTYYLATGDFDGDNFSEFVVGGYSRDISISSKNYWRFEFYKVASNDTSFVKMGELLFDQITSVNAISAFDFDGDGDKELVLALSPNLYVIDYQDGQFKPIWRGDCDNTYQIATFPSVQGQSGKFIINALTGGNLKSFLVTIESNISPIPTPENFVLRPIDASRVLLQWNATPSINQYHVYRSFHGVETLVATTINTQWTDTGLLADSTYQYAVSAFDGTNEGPRTLWKQVVPNAVPSLIHAKMVAPNIIELLFDQKMATSCLNVGHYSLSNPNRTPSSVIPVHDQAGFLLRFTNSISYSEGLQLSILGLAGVTNVTFPDTVISVQYVQDTQSPELVSGESISDKEVVLTFSEIIDDTASNVQHYQLTLPACDLSNSISRVVANGEKVTLSFSKPLQYSNEPYYVSVNSLVDLAGNLISPQHNKCRIHLTDNIDLKHLIVFPNPVYASQSSVVKFSNFPVGQKGKLKIFDLSGSLVYESAIDPSTNSSYAYSWNLCNNSGSKVSSGVYLYVLEMANNFRRGKLAVFQQ